MEVAKKVEDVVKAAILNYAKKKNLTPQQVQISLYIDILDSKRSAGKYLENYKSAASFDLKEILGAYKILSVLIGLTIINSLKKIAVENNVSDYEVSAVFIYNTELVCWIYINGIARKQIKVEQFIN